jgi:hypothetical protein
MMLSVIYSVIGWTLVDIGGHFHFLNTDKTNLKKRSLSEVEVKDA